MYSYHIEDVYEVGSSPFLRSKAGDEVFPNSVPELSVSEGPGSHSVRNPLLRLHRVVWDRRRHREREMMLSKKALRKE